MNFQEFEEQLEKYPHSVMVYVDTCGYDEDGNPIRETDLFTMVTENERDA